MTGGEMRSHEMINELTPHGETCNNQTRYDRH